MEAVPQRDGCESAESRDFIDKFHIVRHLGEALDAVRKSEYARIEGRQRRYIKGQKYTLLSRRENLSLSGKQALKALLAANKRLDAGLRVEGNPSDSFGSIGARPGRGGFSQQFGAPASGGSA